MAARSLLPVLCIAAVEAIHEISWETGALIAVVIFLASVSQAMLGFGFGLVSIPLLVAFGLSLPQGVVVSAMGSFFHGSVAAFSLKQYIPWTQTRWAVGIRMVFVPMGIFLLAYLATHFRPEFLKQILGAAILLVLATRIRGVSRIQCLPPTLSKWFAFSASGLMAGALGIGGPPLVLWATAQRDWNAKTIKAFILSVFSLTLPFQIALLIYKFHQEISLLWKPILLSFPLLYLGVISGLRLSRSWDTTRLRFYVNLALAALALKLLFKL